ncbi:M15 family metallopeptidase [Microbacterium pygmaeum]|uniref:D-alanyl-D-alanine carboxypeptidase n=1 Tax=Microbacterium pygmaeum TaxID=370764 RepID=A0A1G7TYF7_9MICO|nr:M15 family metallopeptidase [Microbacterium pygmaeum]SDG39520.1 D-alanyl-D-alanine carboxypeptidase [Microbacterium pygmaeum]
MTQTTRIRPRRILATGAATVLMASAAIAGIVASQAASSGEAPTFSSTVTPAFDDGPHQGSPGVPGGAGGLTEADGILPDGVGVFDGEYPAVANIHADLLKAVRAAADDASADGIRFIVNSGWRSAAYQDQLLQDALAQYGSESEAARWVLTAETSAHVAGDAIDIGPVDAQSWLSQYGAAYGLCQTYANEMWHFELRPEAITDGCPASYSDPTEDPRTQR